MVANVEKAPSLSSKACFHCAWVKQKQLALECFDDDESVFLLWLQLRTELCRSLFFSFGLQGQHVLPQETPSAALKLFIWTHSGCSKVQTFPERSQLSQLSVMWRLIHKNYHDWVLCQGRLRPALGEQNCCVCKCAKLHSTRKGTHKCNTKGCTGKACTWIWVIMLSKTTHTPMHKHTHSQGHNDCSSIKSAWSKCAGIAALLVITIEGLVIYHIGNRL